MSFLIAFSGKGGVGKTTLAALTVKQLVDQGKTPVLAIDADPNSCLDAMLGVEVTSTIGHARETVREESEESKISKQELLRMKIQQGLVEAKGFDLIAMGRPEGAGCYCYANNVLKQAIGELSGQYPYVVLDNEAGLENLSRRIVQAVDVLVLVSDASNAGIRTLERLYDLATEMDVKYSKLILAVNRTRGGALPESAARAKEYTKADEVIALPYDEEIAEYAEQSKAVWDIPEENPVGKAIGEMVKGLF
ncbi:AAA family ATPase [Christensenellaceae bacterium OttesenSCG-928-K19]|nr:AAA family ATPase [Christensenellaceae bacterium OttesenSCG-928-K19]